MLSIFWKAPGRISAVLAGVVQTNPIAYRIAQGGFAPEPWLILRPGLELEARGCKLLHSGIEILDFEVDDDAVSVRRMVDSVQ